jgi:hypothetical protein
MLASLHQAIDNTKDYKLRMQVGNLCIIICSRAAVGQGGWRKDEADGKGRRDQNVLPVEQGRCADGGCLQSCIYRYHCFGMPTIAKAVHASCCIISFRASMNGTLFDMLGESTLLELLRGKMICTIKSLLVHKPVQLKQGGRWPVGNA